MGESAESLLACKSCAASLLAAACLPSLLHTREEKCGFSLQSCQSLKRLQIIST